MGRIYRINTIYNRSFLQKVSGNRKQMSFYGLIHLRQHRLNERKLKELMTVHNYHTRRTDGTTAAERFLKAAHENLFE